MSAFKHAGASYAILTSKHHDGFCLWPTATTRTHSTAHAATAQFGHKDIVLEFKSACERWGLRFGLYYSWSEFDRACTKEYMDRVVVPQIDELIRYAPEIVWFDGDWSLSTKYAQSVMDACVRRIKQRLPRVEINDRVGHAAERKRDPSFLGLSTYRVYEDRAIPTTAPSVPWEHVNTIGLSWGRNRQQTDAHYKSGAELVQLYHRVVGLNGRFCLNVGPDPDGRLCPEELDRLQALGQLLP
jgi:alpha-L-fucosidase